MTDNEIIKASERLKSTKDYLRECYQNDLKNCQYPEIKPLIKDTYEDNKQAFDIAIKAIEDYNRQQAELEEASIGVKSYKGKYESAVKTAKELQTLVDEKQAEIKRLRVKCEKRTQEKLELGRIYTQKLKTAKAEAIKEFAERLKKHLKGNGGLYCVTTMNAQIDNLAKEMVGEDK